MIALIVIIIGGVIALLAEDNEGMQGFGVGVAVGGLIVGVGGWLA